MGRLGGLVASLCLVAGGVRAQLVHDLIHAPLEVSESESVVLGKNLQVTLQSESGGPAFTGVALQGMATGDSLSGEIRFGKSAQWSEWFPLYIVRSGTDAAFLAAYRGDVVRNEVQIEIRLTVLRAHTVQIIEAGTFDQRLDENGDGHAAVPAAGPTDHVILAPNVRRRREWGAQPFRGNPIPLNRPTYVYMTLHHTAGFGATTLSEGLDQVRRIQDFHQNGRGWSDIGYQFLMDQEGRLYQGRPFMNESVPFREGPPLAHGAHVGGANTGNIGVSLMGCYHPPEGSNCEDEMTQSAIDSLLVTFAFLSERYGVAPTQMRGHRDFSATACPGISNYVMLDGFRAQVADLLIRGNAPLGSASMLAEADAAGMVKLQWRFTEDLGITDFSIQRRREDSAVTLIKRTTVMDGRAAIPEQVGTHAYALVARGDRNREQVLATATVEVEPGSDDILMQSFPNPAWDHVLVRYFLGSEAGLASVRIFDLAGREVYTGDAIFREAGQWYTEYVSASQLPSGTYFYQIQVDGYSGTVFKAAKPLIVFN